MKQGTEKHLSYTVDVPVLMRLKILFGASLLIRSSHYSTEKAGVYENSLAIELDGKLKSFKKQNIHLKDNFIMSYSTATFDHTRIGKASFISGHGGEVKDIFISADTTIPEPVVFRIEGEDEFRTATVKGVFKNRAGHSFYLYEKY